ncbi:hypothetical protein BH24PSE2_BH24PSE2_16240 [soil metagenome]
MKITLTVIMLLIAAAGARADTLLLDGIEAAEVAGADRPARGMTMDRVESRFGQPISRGSAVGEPPISRWEYPDFIVYFEHRHVIHAVSQSSESA